MHSHSNIGFQTFQDHQDWFFGNECIIERTNPSPKKEDLDYSTGDK